MSPREKNALLRARARALRRRAELLQDTFNQPSVKELISAVMLRIDDEIDWVAHVDDPAALPLLRNFLPRTIRTLELLDVLLRTRGRNADVSDVEELEALAAQLAEQADETSVRPESLRQRQPRR
jgi:hypothetical protein